MYEQLIDMFTRYPIGMMVRLKDDYPGDANTVADYKTICGAWYLVLSNGTKVSLERLEELEVR